MGVDLSFLMGLKDFSGLIGRGNFVNTRGLGRIVMQNNCVTERMSTKVSKSHPLIDNQEYLISLEIC